MNLLNQDFELFTFHELWARIDDNGLIHFTANFYSTFSNLKDNLFMTIKTSAIGDYSVTKHQDVIEAILVDPRVIENIPFMYTRLFLLQDGVTMLRECLANKEQHGQDVTNGFLVYACDLEELVDNRK